MLTKVGFLLFAFWCLLFVALGSLPDYFVDPLKFYVDEVAARFKIDQR